MATIYISGLDASRDFAGLMAMVRSGAEVIIEDGAYPPAILRSAEPVRRTISECIELARKHEEETGEASFLDPDFAPRTISESIEIARKLRLESGESPVLDADFAEDVAEIIRNRKPWTPPAWD